MSLSTGERGYESEAVLGLEQLRKVFAVVYPSSCSTQTSVLRLLLTMI